VRLRGIGLGGIKGPVLTRTSERERSGLSTWETEGGSLETAAARPVAPGKTPRRRSSRQSR
jgi:hypothetical protein